MKEKSDWQRWKSMQIYFLFFEEKTVLRVQPQALTYGFYNRYLQRHTVMWGMWMADPLYRHLAKGLVVAVLSMKKKSDWKKSFSPQVETIILKWGQSTNEKEAAPHSTQAGFQLQRKLHAESDSVWKNIMHKKEVYCILRMNIKILKCYSSKYGNLGTGESVVIGDKMSIRLWKQS